MNINNPTSFSTPDLTLSTSNSSGTSGALRADDTILVYDTTVPGTIAASASAATGSAETSARRDHVHGSAAAYTTFAAPNFTLGTSNVSGSGNSVHAGATLLAFDATLPDAITFGQSAAAGSAVVCARRDHSHGMAADPAGLVLIGSIEADDDASLTVEGLASVQGSFLIQLSDIIPAGTNPDPWIRVGDSGGVDAGASDYTYLAGVPVDNSTNYAGEANQGAPQIVIGNTSQGGPGNDTGEGLGASLTLHRPGDGTVRPIISGTICYTDGSGQTVGGFMAGQRVAVITLDRIQFLFSSGNITSGRLTVWGYNHG